VENNKGQNWGEKEKKKHKKYEKAEETTRNNIHQNAFLLFRKVTLK
jgi:hypothetical protein